MSRLLTTTLSAIGSGLFLISVDCATVSPILGQTVSPITGQGKTRTQSETAAASAYGPYSNFVTVSYNDETDTEQTILYTPTSRTVLSGASAMGWSYSTNRAQTWHYGGKVSPPPGWPILWGDPAITALIGPPNYVFLSSLAVPVGKYPPGGVVGLFSSGGVSPIGGACIARSTDGGVTFKFYQCVNTSAFDFYDGGSMESSIFGEVFAAYRNVPQNRIDVWRSPSPDGLFSLLPDPFPGMKAFGHPLLRVKMIPGILYVMIEDPFGALYINRFVRGAWQKPRLAGINHRVMEVKLSDRVLRGGVDFSFDVGGWVAEDDQDGIRVLYTVYDPNDGRLHLTGSMCRADLLNCYPAPGWSTKLPGDQFMPNVRDWSFLWFHPTNWKATFVSRDTDPDGNTVLVRSGNLVSQNGLQSFPTHKLLDPQLVCPDQRGYWGDYNDLQSIGNTRAAILYTFSDSRAGCTDRSMYTSQALHVLGVVE